MLLQNRLEAKLPPPSSSVVVTVNVVVVVIVVAFLVGVIAV